MQCDYFLLLFFYSVYKPIHIYTNMCNYYSSAYKNSMYKYLHRSFMIQYGNKCGHFRNQSSVTPKCQNSDQLQTMTVGSYSINYVKVGQGPHVVFCHPGILGTVKIHTIAQIQSFDREKFTFVTWDQPGYSKSTPPERILNDDSLSEDTHIMIEFMKRLGFSKYSVMGWSGGGCSALLAAIKHPEVIRKLVIWGTFSYVDADDALNYKYFQNRENRKGKMMEILVDEYGAEFFDKHFGGWMNVFARIHTNNGGQFMSKNLHHIECPTMILHGTDDGLVNPKHGKYLEENIKNAKLVNWEGGKHNLHLRYPDKFNRIVQDFLLKEDWQIH